MTRITKTLLVAAVAASALLAPTAYAGPLGPNRNKMEFTLALGPGAYMGSGSGFGSFAVGAFEMDFMYHLFGKGDGPAIGGGFNVEFGASSLAVIEGGLKFRWDFLVKNLVYLAPFIEIGGGGLVASGPFGSASKGGFHLEFGGEVRLCFNGMGLLFVRPLVFDFNIGEGGGHISFYKFLVGGGVSF